MDKKIAMVIAFRDFRDEEYFIPKGILEKAGFKVATISSSLGGAIAKLGGEAEVDFLLKEVSPADFQALLFIGGPGAVNYFDDPVCHQLSRDFLEPGKILGAICIAPAILAKAGVLKGRKATVWSSAMDKSAVKILKNSGAIYLSQPVVVDDNIITANGPLAAKEFALAIIEIFKKNAGN